MLDIEIIDESPEKVRRRLDLTWGGEIYSLTHKTEDIGKTIPICVCPGHRFMGFYCEIETADA